MQRPRPQLLTCNEAFRMLGKSHVRYQAVRSSSALALGFFTAGAYRCIVDQTMLRAGPAQLTAGVVCCNGFPGCLRCLGETSVRLCGLVDEGEHVCRTDEVWQQVM